MSETTGEFDVEARAWLRALVHEFYQTERSAELHPAKEADRVGRQSAPGRAMIAVSAHAARSRESARSVFDEMRMPDEEAGAFVGEAFSAAREHVADKLLSAERSYRATMLGIAHGIDLAIVMRGLCDRLDDGDAAVTLLGAWVRERRALLEGCREALGWFHERPALARKPADRGAIARAERAVVDRVGRALAPDTER